MTARWDLRRWLRKNGQEKPNPNSSFCETPLQVGDFTIDPVDRSATLRGEPLRLTSEEFDVLVFLTTHPQRWVTPQTMLATSGNSEKVHRTEFLRALVSLRKKLEAAGPGQQYLRTEPWIIYRFAPHSSLAT
jgi:DNA-binding response OmpR family regulator